MANWFHAVFFPPLDFQRLRRIMLQILIELERSLGLDCGEVVGCLTLSLEVTQWLRTLILSHQVLTAYYVSHIKLLWPLCHHSI